MLHAIRVDERELARAQLRTFGALVRRADAHDVEDAGRTHAAGLGHALDAVHHPLPARAAHLVADADGLELLDVRDARRAAGPERGERVETHGDEKDADEHEPKSPEERASGLTLLDRRRGCTIRRLGPVAHRPRARPVVGRLIDPKPPALLLLHACPQRVFGALARHPLDELQIARRECGHLWRGLSE